MEIRISRVGEAIAVFKDFSDVTERGELSHLVMELELLKQQAIAQWEKMD